jgi:hypothetical protein
MIFKRWPTLPSGRLRLELLVPTLNMMMRNINGGKWVLLVVAPTTTAVRWKSLSTALDYSCHSLSIIVMRFKGSDH